MTDHDNQNSKQRRTDDALERAMLIDRIARLERQLETAEGRVRNAEQNAKDAKSALAGTLIDKARHQKSGQAATHKTAPAKQDQRPAVPDEADDMERALRAEYEEKFQAARERLGREFQQRLIDVQASWKAEAAQRALEERASRPRPVPAHDMATVEILPGTRRDSSHRAPRAALPPRRRNPLLRSSTAIVLVLAVAVGVAIFMARETFRTAKAPAPPAPASASISVPAPSPAPSPAKATSPSPALTAAAPPPESAPASQPPTAVAEPTPTPAPAVESTVTKQPAEQIDSAPALSKTAAVSPTAPANTVGVAPAAAAPTTPPPAASDRATAADRVATTGKATEPATVQPSDGIDAQRKVLEHDAALTAKLDALRKRLDTASRRADAAETALRAERKKTAEEAAKLQSMAAKAASAKKDAAPPQPLFPPPRFGVVE